MDEAHRPAVPPERVGVSVGPSRAHSPLEGRKDWDRHVRQADELSRTPGFRDLRDRIVTRAAPAPGERVLDVGSGTGLLALAVAPSCAGVWAIDVAPAMVEHLRWVLAGAEVGNVYPLVASAVSLPFDDDSIDLVVSNYCFHHLTAAGKQEALADAFRVLRPGGRLVFGDMMFGWSPGIGRNRAIVGAKVRAIARRGPAGYRRILANGFRLLSGRGEHPAPPDWWQAALLEAGFDEIRIELLAHEGGIASATKAAAPG
ncbi:MAG: methyltransferase domain-containing protein [Actinobacteria bacterium]|nr:methyltransferase domain-containing protein [Actinomycetota bacterium]